MLPAEGMRVWRDARHLTNEQGKSNTDAANGSGAMLLNNKHEDGEDQLSCQEELEEEGLLDTDASVERRRGVKAAAGHDTVGEPSACNAAKDLGDEDDDKADKVNGTSCEHGNGDCGVEHATSDAEEGPVTDLS